MKIYGVLTRFGDHFEVAANDIDEARSEAEGQIEVEGQRGDSVHQVQLVPCPIQGIRDDLAEIMSK